MSLKDAIKEIPELVKMLKEKFNEKKVDQKFKDAKLQDGSIVRYDGDMPVMGMPIQVISETGEVMPLADGEYVLEDGTILKVAQGMIAEVVAPQAEAVEAPQDMADPNQSTPMNEASVKKIVESIVKETVFSKEEIDSKFSENKTYYEKVIEENKLLKAELEKQKELLKETFSLVEKIAGLPVTETKQEKKDGFKKVKTQSALYASAAELSNKVFK
jgi:hypothetical protein